MLSAVQATNSHIVRRSTGDDKRVGFAYTRLSVGLRLKPLSRYVGSLAIDLNLTNCKTTLG